MDRSRDLRDKRVEPCCNSNQENYCKKGTRFVDPKCAKNNLHSQKERQRKKSRST